MKSSSVQTNRKLVAIMFADIVGYTALMQKDETQASRVLKRFQVKLQETVLDHKGEVVDIYGDGALCTFMTPLDAVKCSLKIQQIFQEDIPVPLRIGLHAGTVIFEDGRIYGDSVNITSRIESMGVAGAILISRKVRDDIKNNPDLQISSLGIFHFKNVEEPLEVFCLTNQGLVVPDRRKLRGKFKNSQAKSKTLFSLIATILILLFTWYWWKTNRQVKMVDDKSIAVLAFEDMSQHKDQEYFSDGIAEEILNALSKLEGLKVSGRISSFSFKGRKDLNITDIAQQLNVNTILNGSVRRSGDKLRITANLINASDGFQIWSETFDESLKDIFEIQEKIARSIVQRFRLNLNINQEKGLLVGQTSNLAAYEKYLEGNFHMRKTSDGMDDARKAFEHAIELDSSYALAHAGLAQAYFFLGFYNIEPRDEYYAKARVEIKKAIDLDGSNSDAYLFMGMISFIADYNWDDAWRYSMIADSLSNYPNYRHTVQGGFSTKKLSYFFIPKPEKIEPLVREFELLVESDPLSVETLLELNRVYLDTKNYSRVIENSEKIFKLKPDQRSALRHIGEAYMFSGQPEKSLPYFERAITFNNYTFYNYITNLVYLDRKEEAHRKYNERKDELDSFAKCVCLFALGEIDDGFRHLDHAYEERHPYLVFYKVIPHFEAISSDSRFREFEAKMNFPREILN